MSKMGCVFRVVKGKVPQLNDKVLVEAVYNGDLPFKWHATSVQSLGQGKRVHFCSSNMIERVPNVRYIMFADFAKVCAFIARFPLFFFGWKTLYHVVENCYSPILGITTEESEIFWLAVPKTSVGGPFGAFKILVFVAGCTCWWPFFNTTLLLVVHETKTCLHSRWIHGENEKKKVATLIIGDFNLIEKR